MNCPRCGAELDYDEVDVGVGTIRGNYRCGRCGWSDVDVLPLIDSGDN